MASTKKSSLGNVAPWAEPAWNSIPSPYYNESHKQLRNGLRAYIDENILPNALEWEEAGDVPKEEKFKWLNSGFSANDIPVEYRPKNFPLPAGIPLEKLDAFHLLVSTDETSRVPAGGVMTAMSGANVIGAPPVIHWGTKEQKDRWLPGMFNWTTNFCLGITEPDAGSDVAQLKTTAEKTPDGKFYIVNGYKKWITGAPYATHMTTAVRTSGPGMAGLSVLVIPMNSQGLSHRRIPNSGQKAGGASFIELDNVKVPADHLIGKEGQGFKIIMKNFNRERYVMAVGCNRRARDCMSDAFAYANKRHTFGKPLITNQVIRAKIARIARDVESHWAWLETIACMYLEVCCFEILANTRYRCCKPISRRMGVAGARRQTCSG